MTDPDVKAVIADLVGLEYDSKIRAVGICIVLESGDMRINFAAPEGTKQALFTATAILQRQALDHFKPYDKETGK